jgi:two-component system sensor histidine kinase KdpD
MITAITAGQLSARAKQRAQEADFARLEIERLYHELQDSFEQASQAKALQQSERLKSALLDAVTHDLRTPLTSIKASITTLLDAARGRTEDNQDVTLDAESRTEMLEIINEECDRLNRFIGGLIELARIEAGELRLRLRWSAVDEIIATALTRAEPVTGAHKINLDIEKELPIVRVDERAVSEVVFTLVDNAAKYSPSGSTISIIARRAGEGMIEMSVEDSGVGIPMELRDRVFDKFFRATRNGDVKAAEPFGTGMGLAIAKGIVEAHDGRIWIESGASGKGTRVCFTLPVGDEEHAATDSNMPNSPLDTNDR